jgi:hypothetical protein
MLYTSQIFHIRATRSAHFVLLDFITSVACMKAKKKLSHYTPRRRLGERRYSSYSFSTSALDGGKWSASRPGRALALGKRPTVPIVQEAGWAPEPVWIQRLEEKSFRLCRGSNLDRLVVQPVARHYTDWATRLTMKARMSESITWTQSFQIYAARLISCSTSVSRRLSILIGFANRALVSWVQWFKKIDSHVRLCKR